MPKTKFTVRNVRNIKAPDPDGVQRIYTDPERPGLGVMASGTTPAKTWTAMGSLNGRTLRQSLGPVSPKLKSNR